MLILSEHAARRGHGRWFDLMSTAALARPSCAAGRRHAKAWSTVRNDTQARTIAATVREGAKRRVVGAGGVGKTFLLDAISGAFDRPPAVRWNAGIEPDRLPPDEGVVLVDDAHLATADAVQALVRRTDGVVVAHRPTRREMGELLGTMDSAPTVLGPLGYGAVHDLLADRWGTQPDAAIVASIKAATGGLAKLVTAVAGHEPITEPRRTATLDELVRSDRERLRASARGLLDAAAILGDLDLSLLAAASGLPIDDATAAASHLAAVGLALDAGVRLPPLVGAVVRFLAPASAVTTIAERVASAALAGAGDVTRVAGRLYDTGVTGPATARCLLLAVRQSFHADPERAARWITAAGQGGTSTADLAALRALVGFRRGQPEETVGAADELLRADASLDQCELRRTAVEAAAVVLARRGAWVRSAELAEAVGPAGDSATAVAATARLAVGDAVGVRAVLDDFERSAPPGLRPAAAAAVARGLRATLDDDPTHALPQLLEAAHLYELSVPSVPLPESPQALAAVVACHQWEFDVASQILADVAPHDAVAVRHALLGAWAALRRDDLTAAGAVIEGLRGSVDDTRDKLVALAIGAGSARRRGDLDGMECMWRQARPLLLRQAPDLLLSQPIGELLIVGARLGERATVHSCMAGLRKLVGDAGAPPLWALSLRWDELHVAVALNDSTAAHAAATAARHLPAVLGRPGMVVAAATCWAQLLDGVADPHRIRVVARDLAAVGLARDAARLAGAAAIRVADSAQMRGLLQLARDLHGDRAPATANVTDDLSERERDVARHLIAGLTYREIGRQLYLAPKTIEHHVARIRRKLGAGSRAELLLALRRQLSVPAS